MPVELNIVESVTTLDTTVVDVILTSASEPGPAGPGVATGGTAGQVLTKDSGTDFDTSWQDASGGPGAVDAEDVTFTPAGTIAATDVQAAVEEVATDAASDLSTHSADTTGVHGIVDTSALALTANVQPLDSDLTAIAALTTTAFGRGLLELANQAALLSAAGAAAASHAHAGEDITSGTVADARIASTIARDSEVTSAISALSSVYQPLDSDLTSIAALTTTTFGRAFLALADEAAFKAAVNLEANTDFYAPAGTDVALADGGTGASLTDPNADRVLFWDDSGGAVTWLTMGTNLTITNTTLDASGGGSAADDESLILHMAVFA